MSVFKADIKQLEIRNRKIAALEQQVSALKEDATALSNQVTWLEGVVAENTRGIENQRTELSALQEENEKLKGKLQGTLKLLKMHHIEGKDDGT